MQNHPVKIIREIRQRRDYSQRGLAAKAGVSFRCVQQMESSGHNWRIATLSDFARAFGLPNGGVEYVLDRYFAIEPDSVADASLRIRVDGFESWKIHLFNCVDRFRATLSMLLVKNPPVEDVDPKIRALFAATVESLCLEVGQAAPTWCRAVDSLGEPWFVAGVENLKSMALVESPACFRARNIFVLANFLWRA